jgi:hypothetical protein
MASHVCHIGRDGAIMRPVGKVIAVSMSPASSSPRTARTWYPVLALAGWTGFVWLVRIKNALGDDAMTSGGRAVALLTSLLFLVGAGTVVWSHHTLQTWARRAAAGFAVVSGVYWVIRLLTILGRNHSAGFKVVHAVLALGFVGLAAWVVRAAGGGNPGGPRPLRPGRS